MSSAPAYVCIYTTDLESTVLHITTRTRTLLTKGSMGLKDYDYSVRLNGTVRPQIEKHMRLKYSVNSLGWKSGTQIGSPETGVSSHNPLQTLRFVQAY